MPKTRSWDGQSYDRISGPMEALGREVLGRLGLVLGPHYQHLPAELRERFMDDVLAELGEPVVVDYVRLNIDAAA
jgi:hypothetical protein